MKPVMVMLGGFTNRIFAVRRYKDRGDGLFEVLGGAKDDVTQQAIRAVIQHVDVGCTLADCECQYITLRKICGVIYPVPEPGEVVKHCTLHPRHECPHCDGKVEW